MPSIFILSSCLHSNNTSSNYPVLQNMASKNTLGLLFHSFLCMCVDQCTQLMSWAYLYHCKNHINFLIMICEHHLANCSICDTCSIVYVWIVRISNICTSVVHGCMYVYWLTCGWNMNFSHTASYLTPAHGCVWVNI